MDFCQSYNRPDLGGVLPPLTLPAPSWSAKRHISIDACIADVIQHLWDKGIVTRGCCCGHGGQLPGPTVIVEAFARTEEGVIRTMMVVKNLILEKEDHLRNWEIVVVEAGVSS